MTVRPLSKYAQTACALLLLSVGSAERLSAQVDQKKPLTLRDYSAWRSIGDQQISGNGRWVAYTLQYTNVLPADEKPVLVLHDLENGRDVEIDNAHDGQFSRDSRWIVYEVDSIPAPRGSRASDPPDPSEDASGDSTEPTSTPPRIVLRNLATGQTRSWDRIQSVTFNHTSTHLLLSKRPASGGRGRGRGGGGGGGGGGGDDTSSRGADHLLHDLVDGTSLLLGSVSEAAFNRQGDLLAYGVDAESNEVNGLFLMELATDRMRPIDNDTLVYGSLEWSDDGDGIAALKGRPVDDKRERANTLVAFTNVRAAIDGGNTTPTTLDASAPGFPGAGFVISERAALSWSEDGSRVFFGVISQRPELDPKDAPSRDSVPNVDIWLSQDERIQSVQMIQAQRDLNFTFRHALDVASGRFIALTDSAIRQVEISPAGRWAVGLDNRAYIADTARARADIYRLDTATGERRLMLEGQLVGAHEFGISPDGRRFLYWDEDRYQAYDFETGESRTLPGGESGEFLNMEWDYVGPRPAYGVQGFASDGSGVIVRGRYDLWLLPFEGQTATNLTGGEGERSEIRFQLVQTEPIDIDAPRRVRTRSEFDLSGPVTLSAYGQWTKKAGFYQLDGGELNQMIFADARFGNPVRAEQADRMLLTRQTYEEFPDLQVSGLGFDDMTKISEANPQQSEFEWGHTVLIDYENRDGVRLQGVLALPNDYQEGERRPMIVSFYEKNSQNLHRYPAPRYMTGMGSLTVEAHSRGYITLLADVHFRTGSSHSDMLESVEAATQKVIDLGYADPDQIGVHGHSYGGEGAAYIGTVSKMFAAVGMGAGVTDLWSDFSQSWGWSYQVQGGSGQQGSSYYLFGQGRWGTTPFDDPERYRAESGITHVSEAVAPFLIMHGTADPTVAFSEGMNFYNALRYNGKEAIMLAYPEEGHGLRGLANRRDLTMRYFDFFDHHLKGEPAKKWMTDGVPYLEKRERRLGGVRIIS